MAKLLFGVGINDVDYPVQVREKYTDAEGVVRKRHVQTCPYYSRWSRMIERCYSDAYHRRKPSYSDCYVHDDWKRLSVFKAWMELQDWVGKELDKDILVEGNRMYGPDTCVFVDGETNGFFIHRTKRGKCIHYRERDKQYVLNYRLPGEKNARYIVGSKDISVCEKALLEIRRNRAIELAGRQSDPRVARILNSMFE